MANRCQAVQAAPYTGWCNGRRETGTQSYGSHADGRAADQYEIAELPNQGARFFCVQRPVSEARRGRRMRGSNEQGIALVIVIVIGVLMAIAAFAVLMMSINRARVGGLFERRAVAFHAAEGGAVLAMQRLWVNPAYCGGPENIGTSKVVITILPPPCPQPPGTLRTIKAQVVY